ncbi:MAG: hypothetical protein HY077_06070 [Elusimicrobia bacterium]|nr:hypothetical protein [Elusimicrobiota bacterium]
MKRGLVSIAVLASACVPYPDDAPQSGGGTTIVSGPFKTLDAGASKLDSLHFTANAYGSESAKRVSTACEDAYGRIMIDTNLFSFMPRGLYQIVVYADKDEYRRKTAQPEWSGGVTVGNSIYTFNGPALGRTLSHEMTHLIFFEYMAKVNIDHRWVNEGLAVYEENKAAGGLAGGASDIFSGVRSGMARSPIPMDQMISLAPASERQYEVSLWYAQAESMIRFMVERGGRIGFSQYLAQLKEGQSFDRAIAVGFPGAWRDLNDFYLNWERSLR